MNEEDNIVNWIIEQTDPKKQKDHFNLKKRASAYDNRKVDVDNQIFLCEICDHTWSYVPGWIDASKWRNYPKENIPTIGKKRKDCPTCKKIK